MPKYNAKISDDLITYYNNNILTQAYREQITQILVSKVQYIVPANIVDLVIYIKKNYINSHCDRFFSDTKDHMYLKKFVN